MAVFEKLHFKIQPERHLMPFSLRCVKELAAAGIDWRGLHIVDSLSIICALRIEAARRYLDIKAKEKMRAAGVKEIVSASSEDFDSL